MNRRVFTLAAGMLIGGHAAMAADLRSAPGAGTALGQGWTGFYVGANFGYGRRDPSIDFSGEPATQAAFFASGVLSPSVSVDPRGFLGGLEGGYNRQFGRWVIGVEADLAYASIHDFGSADTGIGRTMLAGCLVGPGTTCVLSRTFLYDVSGEQKIDAFGTLRGRGGFLVTDRLLAFATGGLAFGEAKLSAAITNNAGTQIVNVNGNNNPPTPLSSACFDVCAAGLASQWLIGWTIGGGLEYAVGDRWSVKAEYLYYDLGRLSVTFSDPHVGLSTFMFNASADYTGHIVRIGANFKFE
jgi:outer membrane immunogenic protein